MVQFGSGDLVSCGPCKNVAPPPFFFLPHDRELSAAEVTTANTVSELVNEFRRTIRYWLGIVHYTRFKLMEQDNIVGCLIRCNTWHCAYFA